MFLEFCWIFRQCSRSATDHSCGFHATLTRPVPWASLGPGQLFYLPCLPWPWHLWVVLIDSLVKYLCSSFPAFSWTRQLHLPRNPHKWCYILSCIVLGQRTIGRHIVVSCCQWVDGIHGLRQPCVRILHLEKSLFCPNKHCEGKTWSLHISLISPSSLAL